MRIMFEFDVILQFKELKAQVFVQFNISKLY